MSRSRQAHRLGGLLFVAATLSLGGCTNHVIPPASPKEPVQVFLVDHGRHASLFVPHTSTKLVRYAYGDWDWYAKSQTGLVDALSAALWPTQAGLGRSLLRRPSTIGETTAWLRRRYGQVFTFSVEQPAVAAFRRTMEKLYLRNEAAKVNNPRFGLTFVPHPDSYHLFHNSNDVTASWLESLGCDVQGPRLWSKWSLENQK